MSALQTGGSFTGSTITGKTTAPPNSWYQALVTLFAPQREKTYNPLFCSLPSATREYGYTVLMEAGGDEQTTRNDQRWYKVNPTVNWGVGGRANLKIIIMKTVIK